MTDNYRVAWESRITGTTMHTLPKSKELAELEISKMSTDMFNVWIEKRGPDGEWVKEAQ